MKATLALILSLAVPLSGLADGLATSVCVLEQGQFDNLVKGAGDITKVASGDLWAASLKTGFIGKAPDKAVRLEFSHEGRLFRLHAAEQEGRTLYAVLNITDKANEILAAAGEIARGSEVKEGVGGERLVVVVRTGNFLKK